MISTLAVVSVVVLTNVVHYWLLNFFVVFKQSFDSFQVLHVDRPVIAYHLLLQNSGLVATSWDIGIPFLCRTLNMH